MVKLEGRTLGEFTVRERIGEGGFAVVHRAEQPALEREAVVKALHTHHAKRPEVAQRFLREARLASRLDHPYAAHVYAFGAEPDDTLWIAMELVRGTPMDRLLAEQGPLPLDKLVPLFERICEVVQTAHDRGIVHRDIKPGNVMVLSRAGRLLPKLLDFGIARVLEDSVPAQPVRPSRPSRPSAELPVDAHQTTEWVSDAPSNGTQQGAVIGSPIYMAPEQWIDATSVGPATDIYALGILLYQALTGDVPFRGSTEAVMRAHLETPPPSLGDRVPPAVDAVIARALAKQPRDRYASAGELAAALRAAAGFADDQQLPRLAATVRDPLVAGSVQPLAETIAALDAARNIDQARAIVWDVVATTIRWLGIVAVAARSSVGPGTTTDDEDVLDRLRALARGGLEDAEWLALATDLTAPFVDKRGAYPIPELIDIFHAPASPLTSAYARLVAARPALDRRAGRTPEERRELYADALALLAELLAPTIPLADYTLAVARDGRAESWSGVRRTPRRAVAAPALLDGRVALVKGGASALQLTPLVQVAAPAPGKDDELFVLEGRTSRGARLVAVPYGFERVDATVFDWFRDALVAIDDAARDAPASAVPYRGLSSFSAADVEDFVGRERETEACLNRLRADAMIAVVGPSGAGKSSFVHAGVLPNLPDRWRAIAMRPGSAPLARISACLRDAGIDAPDANDDPPGVAEALREAAARDGGTIVLVVDQFEELFTLCTDDRERARFASVLASATRRDLDLIRVVITLRDDFLTRAGTLHELGDRLVRGLHLLATPAVDDLERILVEPARRAGYEFEDAALVTEMVDAVAGQPSALALLSFTAAELWKLRDRHFHQLTRKAYVAIGGVGGALARHAETTLEGLSVKDRRLVRQAFRHLVTADGTRQVLTTDELRQLLAVGASAARATAVIERLIASRLLVTAEDAGGDRIEIVHEALLGAWPTLVTWRREDAEGARLRDQLRSAARQWDARGRPRGLLWRDDALAEYRQWRIRHPGPLTDVELAFGDTSLAYAARSRRIRRSLLIGAFSVLAIGITLLFQLRGQANVQRARAETQLVEANLLRGQQALLGGDFTHAGEALAQVESAGIASRSVRYMLARVRATESTIAKIEPPAIGGKLQQLRDITFSPDGTRLLTSGRDSAARIWSVAGAPIAILDGHLPQVQAAWSRDGERVATTDATGGLRMWTKDGALVAAVRGPDSPSIAIAYSPDGSRIATGTRNGTLAIWDGRSGQLVKSWQASSDQIDSIVFSPAGDRVLVSGQSGKPSVWTLEGASELELVGHTQQVWSSAFAGSHIVTVSHDHTARIWDAGTGAVEHVLRAHEERVLQLAVEPSGLHVATASADGTIRIWKIANGELLATLRGHGGQVNCLEYIADDKLVSGGADGTVRVWEASRGVQTAVFAHGGYIARVHVDASRSRVASASWAGDARVWDLGRQTRVQLLSHSLTKTSAHFSLDHGPPQFGGDRVAQIGPRGVVVWQLGTTHTWSRELPATSASVSADGAFVAVGDARGSVQVFDALTGEARGSHALHRDRVLAVGIDPASRIAASYGGGTLVRWELQTGRVVDQRPLDPVDTLVFSPTGDSLLAFARLLDDERWHTGWLIAGDRVHALAQKDVVADAAFAPDGRVVTASWRDGAAHVWDPAGRLLLVLRHPHPVVALAWSPDGRWIATGGGGGVLTIWDALLGTSAIELDAHSGFIASLGFDATGDLLATTSGDHTVKVWAMTPLGMLRPLEIERLLLGNDYAEQVALRGGFLVTSGPWGSDVWRAD